MMIIYSETQTLTLQDLSCPVSTAKNGLGEEDNSFKTPRGRFKIAAKIGENAPKYTIFTGRKAVGIWDNTPTDEDLILSRILWLEGIEKHNANTKKRYIYIHGTNHEDTLGIPTSKGCIRTKNEDIITLFDLVQVGDEVRII